MARTGEAGTFRQTVNCKHCGSRIPIPEDLAAKAVYLELAQKAVGSVRCACGEYVPFVVPYHGARA